MNIPQEFHNPISIDWDDAHPISLSGGKMSPRRIRKSWIYWKRLTFMPPRPFSRHHLIFLH
jgi:hypothetical protein